MSLISKVYHNMPILSVPGTEESTHKWEEVVVVIQGST
jgi:hypothetical protein